MLKSTLSILILIGLSFTFSANRAAPNEAQTNLPERIVHKESGITLILIPAGRFQMGSPVDEPERSNKERQHWRVVRSRFISDVYHVDYPADGADESAAGNGNARVMRGGSWLDPPDLYRMAKRFAFLPQGRRDFLGFRVVMKARPLKGR